MKYLVAQRLKFCEGVLKKMVELRSAKANECDILTNIATKSEAYWGYDSEYMNRFKTIYNVNEEFIKNNPTVIIEDDKNIVGFYGVINNWNEVSLEYFFIIVRREDSHPL